MIINKKIIVSLVLTCSITCLLTATGFAADEKPVDSSAKTKVLSYIEKVKTKAVFYYHFYYTKYFGSKEASEQVVDNRTPASATVAVATTTAPSVDPEKLATLPTYKTQGVEEQTKQIKSIHQEITQKSTYDRKQGRAADVNLKKTKSGVVIFDLYEKPAKGKKTSGRMVKNIPLLNIGTEDEVLKNSFEFELPKIFTAEFQKAKALPTPDMIKQSELEPLYKIKFDLVQKPQKLDDIKLALPKDITAEKISQIQLLIGNEIAVSLHSYTELTKKQIDLLVAIIFAEYQDRCHLSTGFFKDLSDLSGIEKDLRDHYYGSCLYKMGFYTEGVPMLMGTAVKNIGPYSKSAVELLLTDVRREFVPEISEALQKVTAANIPEKKTNEYYYYVALGQSIKDDHKTALAHALKVKHESTKYPEAQYLASVSEYLLGDAKSALDRQEALLLEIDKRKVAGPLKTLIKMNLGRTAYRNKQYKKAIESYQFVGRENSLWIQSLTEQGWMQILAGDAPGAIGNMHSIQIPQFKDIYKPESYVVRAIGYINICQYGDAKKSLEHLAKIYSPWISIIKSELKKEQFNYAFYQNVVDALRSTNNKTTLPQPVLREISRHKDFLNVQEAINNKVDENVQFGFIRGLVEKDIAKAKSKMAAAKGRAKELDRKIKSAKSVDDTLKFVTQWKSEKNFENDTAEYYDFEINTLQASQGGFKNFEQTAKKNLEEAKQNLKSGAGKIMKTRLASMQKRLEKLIENNEFLTYEILSGSGENIRYISAGGNVKGTQSTRETASKSNEKGKVFLWDFDGEFWADEVGSYKSSLKDNCPNANSLTNKVK